MSEGPGAGDEHYLELAARQAAAVDDLGTRAAASGDPLDWIALERQARRYLRGTEGWASSRMLEGVREALMRQRARLAEIAQRAGGALEELGPHARLEAERRCGLRLAVLGKGGAGKSVVAGTLARLLARARRRVLAADLDTNPGLAFSLGLPDSEAGLPAEALEEHPGAPYGHRLSANLSPADVGRAVFR